MRLETSRLILRDYEASDLNDSFRLKSDEETMYYLQDIKLSSFAEAEKDMENVLADMKSDNRKLYFFYAELKDTHENIGSIGYNVECETPAGKHVHLGYFIYPKYWNKGYVTEAATRVLEYAFLENNVYRVSTGCLAENKGSERVMQKCGMIKEAERVDWEWHDGKLKTRLEYRLLRSEWLNNRVPHTTVTFYGDSDIADAQLKYAVIAARYLGKWLFCRHKARDTWEIPGGHREPGETIAQTAERELYEETGAVGFSLEPISVYGVECAGTISYGKLFFVEIKTLGALNADFEISETALFDVLPDKLTYSAIQPRLYERTLEWLSIQKVLA